MLRKAIVIFILLVIVPIEASAHRPMFPKSNNSFSRAYVIEDYNLSIAIYDKLTKGKVDYYAIDGKEGTTLFCQMLLPKNRYDESFTPAIAIIGPGLSSNNTKLPMDIPSDIGYVVKEFSKTKSFFEPFTQTSYIMGEEFRVQLPTSARYYIVVYNNQPYGGRYALAVGEKEEWGLREIAKFPVYWFRVRFWYNPWSTLLIVGLCGALIAYLIFRRK
jgi:hypothetical protein